MSKPWSHIPIHDIGEKLHSLSASEFKLCDPHPYRVLGAPYQGRNPFRLRSSVLQRLRHAAETLQQQQAGWKFLVFDAWRPNAVQQFMVDHTWNAMLAAKGWQAEHLSDSQQEALRQEVYRFWSIPSDDPKTPPAHSTGSAIDLSMVDSEGNPVDMGTPFDEFSERAAQDYFADASDVESQQIHANRVLLKQVMASAGFVQHPAEWWHFSYGDQLWAWRSGSKHAIYGAS